MLVYRIMRLIHNSSQCLLDQVFIPSHISILTILFSLQSPQQCLAEHAKMQSTKQSFNKIAHDVIWQRVSYTWECCAYIDKRYIDGGSVLGGQPKVGNVSLPILRTNIALSVDSKTILLWTMSVEFVVTKSAGLARRILILEVQERGGEGRLQAPLNVS